MITVGLIFHSAASANLGVGALTVAEVEILRDISKRLDVPIKIRLIDWKLAHPPYISGPDIEIFEMSSKTLLKPSGYAKLVKGCDLVIDIGAGDSFADIYGTKRLALMFWMKYVAHLLRKPLVLAPQTYGPFTKTLSIALTRGTLKRSALVASRDAKSTAAAAKIAPGVAVIEASDVALRLPYDTPAPRDGGRPRVGLNVSGLLMGGGYTGKNMFGLTLDYGAMIRSLIAELKAHPEAPEIHLVSHVLALEGASGIGVEDDRSAALALQKDDPDLIIAPAFDSPQAAKSYIAGMDFFAGARMHACIAAFSSGAPVIPMAYSRKFEGLFGTIGYGRTVDCTAEQADVIIAKIMDGFTNRAALAEEMAPALARGREKLGLYEASLERIIAQAAGQV